ncbi:MAG: hypothetical protein JWN82_673 [Candidatus Saccharibacteria bacterium]|nr:hypothetical protein [Candidatus Saccharibacteria bacterium]
MNQALAERIQRAKVLLETARHATMATVNVDGTPHNTPFFFIHGEKLEYIYWGSHPDALHSQNIVRTGNVFIVVYDMMEKGGLYIKGTKAHKLSGSELEKALEIHNVLRAKEGSKPIDLSYYTGDSPQRMYATKPTNFWVNIGKKSKEGMMLQDLRVEVNLADLI